MAGNLSFRELADSASIIMSLNSPWLEHVASGRKIYEGRRRTEKINEIRPGNIISFLPVTSSPNDKSIDCKVIAIHSFDTFRDALETLPIDRVLPGVRSVDEGVSIYARFVSIPTQIRDGVVMIQLELCTTTSS